jgi:signal transduction histidine kinase
VPAICFTIVLLLRNELVDAGHRLLARLSSRNYVIEDFLEALFEQTSIEAIARTAAARLDHALHPARLVVFCAQSDSKRLECVYTSEQDVAPIITSDNALATALSERGPAFLNSKLLSALTDAERGWISRSGLVLAAPIAGELKAKLSGIIFLGERLSGQRYEATDLDLVEDAARQVYLALTMHELQIARDRALQGREQAEAFAYVASHDLQEPLRMISQFTGLLAMRYRGRLDSDADDYIAYISDAAERLRLMIRDLLALARIDKPAPVHQVSASIVVDLVRVNLFAAIAESGAVLETTELPEVCANEIHLTQLFQNLIGNAIKYRGQEPLRIRVAAERSSGSWCFSVRDNGRGFDMQYSQQIFLPFKRLDGGGDSGSGIGLAICKKIVENRGGRIWVESAPGCGATFYFTIPDEQPVAP